MNNDFWTSLGQLLGAGTVGAILLKVVERLFARADKQDDLAVGLRSEMVARLAKLEARTDELDARLEASRRDNQRLFEENSRLRSENGQLRQRYHGLMNLLQRLVDRDAVYREKLGLPPEAIDIPSWAYQRIPGPTERSGAPRPPDRGAEDRG